MRSCSYYYSRNQTVKFLNSNNIKLIIRGHEVQMKGFKYQYNGDNQPLALTIFSAPKYCDSYKNKGAVAILSVRLLTFRVNRSQLNRSSKWSILSCWTTIWMPLTWVSPWWRWESPRSLPSCLKTQRLRNHSSNPKKSIYPLFFKK